ncbi:MAG: DNA-binding protein [Bacteroidales bacterium]|nr:DNA-binding protein [Bacteroidales bacterium]
MYTYKTVKGDSTEFKECYILSIDNHEEIMAALADFCRKMKIVAGEITGIGAISEATFRFLDPATKNYVDKTFAEQMEITNLTGNISQKDGDVYLHVHLTCSRRDYTCVGGHLLKARINGACELFVKDFGPITVGRRFDPETGLNLYDF